MITSHMTVPVCDVLIVGGGVAGIATAVAVSLAGSRPLIVERDGFAGGLAAGAWVGTICGAARCGVNHYDPITRGWVRSFIDQITERSNTESAETNDHLWYIPYDPAQLRLAATKALTEHNIPLLLHSTLNGIERGPDGRIIRCHIQSWDTTIAFTPKAVVDCTGEATVSRLAEIPFISSSSYQSPALVFRLSGWPCIDEREAKLVIIRDVTAGIKSGSLPAALDRLSIVPGSLRNGSLLMKLGITRQRAPGPDVVSHLSTEAITLIDIFQTWLRSSSTELSKLRIESIAPSIGVRTGSRLRGKKILSKEDVLSGQTSKEAIAIGTWPIEHWTGSRNPEMTLLPPGVCYGIPAPCLESAHIENLFGAGRTLSADDDAIASARVIGTSLQTGWAAGVLAATYAQGKSHNEALAQLAYGVRY